MTFPNNYLHFLIPLSFFLSTNMDFWKLKINVTFHVHEMYINLN
jgi:hypothetical protein